jgi:hypothetical protein
MRRKTFRIFTWKSSYAWEMSQLLKNIGLIRKTLDSLGKCQLDIQ